jgi:copper chaperone CopZ
METKTFKVPGISCGHCVHTIKMEVGDVAGVQSVEADQQTRMVTVTWDNPADWEKIRATLVEINYPPEGLITIN